jgi:hypothetical protein
MSKRFTDTEKWKKPFIRSLKAPYKLLWLYILDECDHAGVWQVDFEVAQIKIGEKLSEPAALKALQGKIIPFSSGEKWFIPDFIEFQYGILNPENRAHNSVIQILQKSGLIESKNDETPPKEAPIEGGTKPLISPLQGAMDMDKGKDNNLTISTVTIVEEGKPARKQFVPPTLDEVKAYFLENGYAEETAIRAHEYYTTGNWKDSKGHKVLNWKQKMISVWFKEQNKIQEQREVKEVDMDEYLQRPKVKLPWE